MIQANQILEFTDVAKLLNYSRSTNIDLDPKESGFNWARYAGKNTLRGVDYPFNVIYLKSSASNADLAEAISCAKRVQNPELVHAASLKLVELKRASKEGLKVLDTKAYLASFIHDELSGYTEHLKEEKPSHYIDPNIKTPSGFNKKTPNPLLNFLLDPHLGAGYSDGTVAVVLAEAGQGKTYMCKHLASTILERGSDVIPILIDSSQWKNMPVADQRSLSKTILNCLHHYGCPVPWLTSHEDEFIAIALKLDLFKIIFDGFDEYLLSNRDVAQEEDVIDAIRNLAEETGARIIITSRTSYWHASIDSQIDQRMRESTSCLFYEMVPFEETHANNYFLKRFGSNDRLVSSADKLFRNLAASARDLVGRGFILNLIADVVGSSDGKSFATILASSNAIDWLIRELCQRDRHRQELPFNSEQQFSILRMFAEEIASGASPDSELLELCMEVVQPVLDRGSRQKAVQSMTSHPILQMDGSSRKWYFREEQVRTYLLAHFLANEQQTSRVARWVLTPGEQQDLIQTVVEILTLETIASPTDSIKTLIDALKIHCSGRFAASLAFAAVEKITPKGKSHLERTECLVELCGSPIKDFEFSGTISSFNFENVSFIKCKFDHATFINCEFDAKTEFAECSFRGGIAPIRCNGLGESIFLDSTSFDPFAQMWIDQVRVNAGKRQYSESDLRNDIGILLERFLNKGRVMLRTVQKSNLTRGAIRSSKYADQIIEEFRKMLLEEHHLSGVSETAYNIRQEFKNDVIFFGQNNSFVGQINKLFITLKNKLLNTLN
ncbi:NACHT domain-containing protein [Prosthecobacter debontii]|uniref:NACHT domain-containing protein n=1 Tax=Prosthecobacter debontii TaxID=48467 RepID=A0A1T4X5Q5_9BACT|nr:NACHT domain-containing protein [Prosthecobacter debontii]SKA84211.1 NACHT domain-containing protein [Prosthecobacter debontii]